MTIVPNQFPKYTSQPYRIAIISDVPNKDDADAGIPLVGTPGWLFWKECAKVGIVREACYVGTVCQHYPSVTYSRTTSEFNEGINRLKDDLIQYQPNLTLCLGATPLWWAKGEDTSIDDWRGSLFLNRHGTKTLATVHPMNVLREYSQKPLLSFDLKRARYEGESPKLALPERNLIVDLPPLQLLALLDQVLASKPTISIDIEGGIDTMSCISIATSPKNSFIVPFTTNFWGDLEPLMWRRLIAILSDPSIGKILQNSLYDLFVLQHSYGIPVRGVVGDTMLAHWELMCEMPKSLAFQTSIYTRQPYYKFMRKQQ